MKIFLMFLILSFSIKSFATNPETSLVLKHVLSDSIVCKYLSEKGEVDTSSFVLFEDSGNYTYHKGTIYWEERTCEKTQSTVGSILKMRSKRKKAFVKFYVRNNDNIYIKVRLRRDDECLPWLIYSRKIYYGFQFPKTRNRSIHWDYWI